MATSFKKIKQASVAEWIVLNDEETADLYAECIKACDVAIAAQKRLELAGDFKEAYSCERKAKIANDTADAVARSKRLSIRQLAVVQRILHDIGNDFLYVSGLEPWLIANEATNERNKKSNVTKDRNRAAREALEAQQKK